MNSTPTLRIDPNSTTPVYRQIVDGLRTLLVNHQLNPGDTLPTVRELAMELGVHFNTVAEAYRQLSAEGWLDLKRRRGAVVTERKTPVAGPEAQQNFATQLRLLIAQVRADGLSIDRILQEMDRLRTELVH